MEPPSLESSTSFKLKDHLDSPLCLDSSDVSKSTDSSDRNRSPKIESHEYWKMKSQPACAESVAPNRAA
jgi:hypothetical protein